MQHYSQKQRCEINVSVQQWMDGWDKEKVLYIHNVIQSQKRMKSKAPCTPFPLPFAAIWMELKDIVLSEIN